MFAGSYGKARRQPWVWRRDRPWLHPHGDGEQQQQQPPAHGPTFRSPPAVESYRSPLLPPLGPGSGEAAIEGGST